jgi:hypothetical protein
MPTLGTTAEVAAAAKTAVALTRMKTQLDKAVRAALGAGLTGDAIVQAILREMSPTLDEPNPTLDDPNTAEQEAPMARTEEYNPSVKPTAKEEITAALQHGAAVGAATAVNRAALTTALATLGDTTPASLQTEKGRKALEIAGPAVLLYLSDFFPDAIPLDDKVRNAATLALEGASAEGVQSVLGQAFPFLAAYAAALKGE